MVKFSVKELLEELRKAGDVLDNIEKGDLTDEQKGKLQNIYGELASVENSVKKDGGEIDIGTIQEVCDEIKIVDDSNYRHKKYLLEGIPVNTAKEHEIMNGYFRYLKEGSKIPEGKKIFDLIEKYRLMSTFPSFDEREEDARRDYIEKLRGYVFSPGKYRDAQKEKGIFALVGKYGKLRNESTHDEIGERKRRKSLGDTVEKVHKLLGGSRSSEKVVDDSRMWYENPGGEVTSVRKNGFLGGVAKKVGAIGGLLTTRTGGAFPNFGRKKKNTEYEEAVTQSGRTEPDESKSLQEETLKRGNKKAFSGLGLGLFGGKSDPCYEIIKRLKNRELEWLGEKDIPCLIKALDYEKEGISKVAISTLADIGEPAIDPLIKALGDKKIILCKNATLTLINIESYLPKNKKTRLFPAINPLIGILEYGYRKAVPNTRNLLWKCVYSPSVYRLSKISEYKSVCSPAVNLLCKIAECLPKNKKDRLIPVIHPLMKCFEAEVLHLDDTCLKMLELVGEPAIEIYIKTTFRHWDLQEDTLQSIERFEKRGIPVSKLLINALEDENEQVRERVVLLLKNNELKTFVKEAYSYFKNNIKSTERQIKEWAGEKKDKLITILRITQSLKRLNIENSEEIISYLLKTKNKTLIESICKNTDQILSGAVINRINTLSSPKDKVNALSLLNKSILQVDAIKKVTEKRASEYFNELGEMPDKDSFVALKGMNPPDENISFGVENWLNNKRKASDISEESRKKASLFFRKHKDMPDGVLPQVLDLVGRGVPEEQIPARLRYVEEIKFLEKHNFTASKKNISFLFKNKKKFSRLNEEKIVSKLEEKQERHKKGIEENLQYLKKQNVFNELNTVKKAFSEIFKDEKKYKLANNKFDDPDVVKVAGFYFSGKLTKLHRKHLKNVLSEYNEGLKTNEKKAKSRVNKYILSLKENVRESRKLRSYGYDLDALKKTELTTSASDIFQKSIKQEEINKRINEIKGILQNKNIDLVVGKGDCISNQNKIIDELKEKTKDAGLIEHIREILKQIRDINEKEIKPHKNKKSGDIRVFVSDDFFRSINFGTYFNVCTSLDDGESRDTALVYAMEENKQVLYLTYNKTIVSARNLLLTRGCILSTVSYNRGMNYNFENIWADFFLKLSKNSRKPICFSSREGDSFKRALENKSENIIKSESTTNIIDKVIFDEFYDDHEEINFNGHSSHKIETDKDFILRDGTPKKQKKPSLIKKLFEKKSGTLVGGTSHKLGKEDYDKYEDSVVKTDEKDALLDGEFKDIKDVVDSNPGESKKIQGETTGKKSFIPDVLKKLTKSKSALPSLGREKKNAEPECVPKEKKQSNPLLNFRKKRIPQEDEILHLIESMDTADVGSRFHDPSDKLFHIGKPAIPYLIEALKDKRVIVAKLSAKLLVKMGKPAIAKIEEFLEEGKITMDFVLPVYVKSGYVLGDMRKLYEKFCHEKSQKPINLNLNYESNKEQLNKNIPEPKYGGLLYKHSLEKYPVMVDLFSHVMIKDVKTIFLYKTYLDINKPNKRDTTSFQSALYLLCILCDKNVISPDKTDELLQTLFCNNKPENWMENNVLPVVEQSLKDKNINISKLKWKDKLIECIVLEGGSRHSLKENPKIIKKNINYILDKIEKCNKGNFLLNLCFASILGYYERDLIHKTINYILSKMTLWNKSFIIIDSYDPEPMNGVKMHGSIFSMPSEIGHMVHLAVDHPVTLLHKLQESEIADRIISSINTNGKIILKTDLALEYIHAIYEYGQILDKRLDNDKLNKILREFDGNIHTLSKANIFYIGLIRKQKTRHETESYALSTRAKIDMIEKYMSKKEPDAIAGILSIVSNLKTFNNIAPLSEKQLRSNSQAHLFAERVAVEFTINIALAFYDNGYSVGVLSYVQHRSVEYILENTNMDGSRDWESVFETIYEINPAQIKRWVNEGIKKREITKGNIYMEKTPLEDIEKMLENSVERPKDIVENYKRSRQFEGGFETVKDVRDADLGDPMDVRQLMKTSVVPPLEKPGKERLMAQEEAVKKLEKVREKNPRMYGDAFEELQRKVPRYEGMNVVEEEEKVESNGFFNRAFEKLKNPKSLLPSPGRENHEQEPPSDENSLKKEKRVFEKREVEYAPEIVLPDKEGNGSAYMFKSPEMLNKYNTVRKDVEKKYEELLKIVKNIRTDKNSREKLAQLFRENKYSTILSNDFKDCYYLLDGRANRKSNAIEIALKKIENKRAIKLIPCCVVVPYMTWIDLCRKLYVKDSVYDTNGMCFYLRRTNTSILFLRESLFNILPINTKTIIHELIHSLYNIVSQTENIVKNSNGRALIDETIAGRIGGVSFNDIEKILVKYYIDYYEIKEKEKFEKQIHEKLIPVAKYLDKNYPRQFFDVMARARSIDELWDAFRDKVGKSSGLFSGLLKPFSKKASGRITEGEGQRNVKGEVNFNGDLSGEVVSGEKKKSILKNVAEKFGKKKKNTEHEDIIRAVTQSDKTEPEESNSKSSTPNKKAFSRLGLGLFGGKSEKTDPCNEIIKRLKNRELEGLGERDIPYLIKALDYEKQGISRVAVSILEGIGEPAIDLLIIALKDKKPILRENATWALRRIGSDLPKNKKSRLIPVINPLIGILKYKYHTACYHAVNLLGTISECLPKNKKDRLFPAIHPLMNCFEEGVLKPDDRSLRMLESIGEPAIEALIKTVSRHKGGLWEELFDTIEESEKRGIPVSKLYINALGDENEQARERVAWSLERIAGDDDNRLFLKEAYSYFRNNIKSAERQVREWAGEDKDKLITILRITQSLKRLDIENPREMISYLLKTENRTLIESIFNNTNQTLPDGVIKRINMLSSPKDKIKALCLLDKNNLRRDAIKEETEEKSSMYFDKKKGIASDDPRLAIEDDFFNKQKIALATENSLKEKENISKEDRRKASDFFERYPDIPNGALKQVLNFIRKGIPEEEIPDRLTHVDEIAFLEEHNISLSKENMSFLCSKKGKLSDEKIVETLMEKQENREISGELQDTRKKNIFNELSTGKKLFSEIFKSDKKFKLADDLFDDPDVVRTASLYYWPKLSNLQKKYLKNILFEYNKGLKNGPIAAKSRVNKYVLSLRENINEIKRLRSGYGYNFDALKKTELITSVSDVAQIDIKQQEINRKVKDINSILQHRDIDLEFNKDDCISNQNKIIDEIKKTKDAELIEPIKVILTQIKNTNEKEIKPLKNKRSGDIHVFISNDFFKSINSGTYLNLCTSLVGKGFYRDQALMYSIEENKQIAHLTYNNTVVSMRYLFLTREGILATRSYNGGMNYDFESIWADFFLELSQNSGKDIYFSSGESKSFMNASAAKNGIFQRPQIKNHLIDKVIFSKVYDDYGIVDRDAVEKLRIVGSSSIKAYKHKYVIKAKTEKQEQKKSFFGRMLEGRTGSMRSFGSGGNSDKKAKTYEEVIDELRKGKFMDFREEKAPFLVKALEHENPSVRDTAVNAIIITTLRIKTKTATINPLIILLGNKDPILRKRSLHVIGMLSEKLPVKKIDEMIPAINPLLILLRKEKNKDVLLAVIKTTGQIAGRLSREKLFEIVPAINLLIPHIGNKYFCEDVLETFDSLAERLPEDKNDKMIPVINPILDYMNSNKEADSSTCVKCVQLLGSIAKKIPEEKYDKICPAIRSLIGLLENTHEWVVDESTSTLEFMAKNTKSRKDKNKRLFLNEVYPYFENNVRTAVKEIKDAVGEDTELLITLLKTTQNLKKLRINKPEEILSFLSKTKNKSLINSIKNNSNQILPDAVINRINTLSSPKDKVRALSLLDKTSLQIDAIKKSTEKGASKYFDELGGMPDKDSFVALEGINPTDENISFGVENWLNKERKASGITGESRKKASLFFRKHKDMPDGVLPQVLALIQRGVHEEEIHNRLRYVEEIKFLENHNITVSKNNISFLFRNKKYLTKLSEDKIVEMLEEKQEKYRKNTKENLQKLRRENIFDELNTGKKIFSEIFKDDRKFKLANGMFDDLDAVKTAALYFSDKLTELQRKHLKNILSEYNEGLKANEKRANIRVNKYVLSLRENIVESGRLRSYGYNLDALKKTELTTGASDIAQTNIRQEEINKRINEINGVLQNKNIDLEEDKEDYISNPEKIIDELGRNTKDAELINHITEILNQIKDINEKEIKPLKNKKSGDICVFVSDDFFKSINFGTYFDICTSLDDGGYRESALVYAVEENKQVLYLTYNKTIVSMRVLLLTRESILSTISYNRGMNYNFENIWADFFLKLCRNSRKPVCFSSREGRSFKHALENKSENIIKSKSSTHVIDRVIFDNFYDDYSQGTINIDGYSLHKTKTYDHDFILMKGTPKKQKKPLFGKLSSMWKPEDSDKYEVQEKEKENVAKTSDALLEDEYKDIEGAVNSTLDSSTGRKLKTHKGGSRFGSIFSTKKQSIREKYNKITEELKHKMYYYGGDEEDILLLTKALEDTNPQVRPNAAKALGEAAQSLSEDKKEILSTINPLIELLVSKDAFLGTSAGYAIEKIGVPTMPFLVDELRKKNKDMCLKVAWLIGKISEDIPDKYTDRLIPTIEPLIKLLDNKHSDMRGRAAWTLGKIAEVLPENKASCMRPAVEPLKRLLESKTEYEQDNAKEALLKISGRLRGKVSHEGQSMKGVSNKSESEDNSVEEEDNAKLLGAFVDSDSWKKRTFVNEVMKTPEGEDFEKNDINSGFSASVHGVKKGDQEIVVKEIEFGSKKPNIFQKIKKKWKEPSKIANLVLERVNDEVKGKYKPIRRNSSKEEYLIQIKVHNILPHNTPGAWDYDKKNKKILMDVIPGRVLRKLYSELENKPELVADLGKIVSTLNNNNIFHGDLNQNNVMLDDNNVWQLIDFGSTKEIIENTKDKAEYQKNDIHKVTRYFSKKLKSVFFESYVKEMNFRNIVASFENEEIDSSDAVVWLDFFKYLDKNMWTSPEEVKIHLRKIIGVFEKEAETEKQKSFLGIPYKSRKAMVGLPVKKSDANYDELMRKLKAGETDGYEVNDLPALSRILEEEASPQTFLPEQKGLNKTQIDFLNSLKPAGKGILQHNALFNNTAEALRNILESLSGGIEKSPKYVRESIMGAIEPLRKNIKPNSACVANSIKTLRSIAKVIPEDYMDKLTPLIKDICAVLEDFKPHVRSDAAGLLYYISKKLPEYKKKCMEDAIEPLIKGQGDKDMFVRRNCSNALESIGELAVPCLKKAHIDAEKNLVDKYGVRSDIEALKKEKKKGVVSEEDVAYKIPRQNPEIKSYMNIAENSESLIKKIKESKKIPAEEVPENAENVTEGFPEGLTKRKRIGLVNTKLPDFFGGSKSQNPEVYNQIRGGKNTEEKLEELIESTKKVIKKI